MFLRGTGRPVISRGIGGTFLAFIAGMRKSGFTLVELLIVILVISILASFLMVGIVAALNAGKEARALQLIKQVQTASEIFARDHNGYPVTQSGRPFDSGPVANSLASIGPRKQPYMYFEEADVMAWPMSDASHIRNPANPQTCIHVRDNTLNPKPRPGTVPIHNPYGLDLWGGD